MGGVRLNGGGGEVEPYQVGWHLLDLSDQVGEELCHVLLLASVEGKVIHFIDLHQKIVDWTKQHKQNTSFSLPPSFRSLSPWVTTNTMRREWREEKNLCGTDLDFCKYTVEPELATMKILAFLSNSSTNQNDSYLTIAIPQMRRQLLHAHKVQ